MIDKLKEAWNWYKWVVKHKCVYDAQGNCTECGNHESDWRW